MKNKTQVQVLEQMLLSNQKVTGSSFYRETNKQCKCGSLNLHVIIRPLLKKYKIKGDWKVNREGRRFKEWSIVNKSVKKVLYKGIKNKKK
jgi:hypothetical protein